MKRRTPKRTPEQIRTIPIKGSGHARNHRHRQVPKKTNQPGAAKKQNKRLVSNALVRTQGVPRATSPSHRVVSTTPRSVMFTLDAPQGRTVSISGSFNDWTPQAMTKGGDGLWRITVQLAQGTYEYRFLVDEEWRDDPNNSRKNPNSLGGYDSICAVL